MRRRVFLAVLLTLVLSLSKGDNYTTATTITPDTPGQNDTVNTTTPMTTTTNSTGDNDTTPTTTTPDTPGQNDTTPTTVDPDTPGDNDTTATTTEPDTTGQNDTVNTTTPTTTTTDSTGLSLDTSPSPNLMTTTDTPGSSSDITPTSNLTITTATPGSPDIFSDDTSNTTQSTNSTGDNDTTPMTTTPDTQGQNDTVNTTTPMTTTTNSTGLNDTVNTTTPMTTTTNSTGENDTTPMTTTPDTPGQNDTVNTTTPMTTTTNSTGDFCNPDPCGTKLATCVPLNSNFTCLCQYGFYYRENNCHRGKIFPGIITLQGTYDSSVLIVNSVEYQEVFENITQFFRYAFENLTGFEQMVIVKIELQKAEGRASAGISVTVINLFTENTTANNDTVTSAVTNAAERFSSVIQYTATTYCAAYNCDARTTVCEENEFPQCTCQKNFSKTEWDTLSCSDCYKECVQSEGKYCVREDELPSCKCLPNFEDKDGKCVSCPVGFSGDNCTNKSELILIIVGTVFGAIILCLAIAVTVVSIRAKHRQDPEKKKLLRSDYSTPNTSDDRQPTMFPRVRTTTGHPNPGYQPNNPYEMRDFDDLYEPSREPEGFRMHNRN